MKHKADSALQKLLVCLEMFCREVRYNFVTDVVKFKGQHVIWAVY